MRLERQLRNHEAGLKTNAYQSPAQPAAPVCGELLNLTETTSAANLWNFTYRLKFALMRELFILIAHLLVILAKLGCPPQKLMCAD
jgi:hypothetical protein